MKIFDRYLLGLFIRVMAVCFVSLSGLFIVIHAFSNLDEFIAYSELEGGLLTVLIEYYGPRVLTFFDHTSPLLTLLAALFAITWLQRTNELTALMAAGVPKRRLLIPLVFGVAVVSGIAIANRELLIPRHRDALSRNAQNWLGDQARPLHPRYDNQTDIYLGGRHTVTAERKIVQPQFRLPQGGGGLAREFGRRIVAGTAYYQRASEDHPAGYLMDQVQMPENIARIPSGIWEGRPVIITPRDASWLESDQCFVVSNVDFQQLAGGDAWRDYSSTVQLVSSLHNPSLDYGADVRVALHARMVQPLLDMAIFLIGLPLVLGKRERNFFVASGLCLLAVGVFFVTVLACHALGNHGIMAPALAAWMPLLIFAPLAYWLSYPLFHQGGK